MNARELIEELEKYPPETMVQMRNIGIVNGDVKSVTVQYTGLWELFKSVGKEREAIAWVNINGMGRARG